MEIIGIVLMILIGIVQVLGLLILGIVFTAFFIYAITR